MRDMPDFETTRVRGREGNILRQRVGLWLSEYLADVEDSDGMPSTDEFLTFVEQLRHPS